MRGNAACAPQNQRGYSLSQKRISPLEPQEKGLHCKRAARRAAMLADCTACVRRGRICPCYTTWCASIIRCRSADLVGVQTNFRLPRHCSMRRAPAMPHPASSLPPSKRHSRLTIVRRGCDLSRIAEIHGEAMYTAPDSASAAALRDTDCQCAGSRGKAPRPFLLGGVRGDVLFPRKENIPPCRIPTRCGVPFAPYGATI